MSIIKVESMAEGAELKADLQETNPDTVLCVGLVVVDIVTVMDTFPTEDIKTRYQKQIFLRCMTWSPLAT